MRPRLYAGLVAISCVLMFPPTAGASVAAQVAATPVVFAACPGHPEALGCTTGDTIYLAHRNQRTLEHERGHVFARLALTDTDRAWFAKLVGMRGDAWASVTPGTESPEERFADAYAACKTGVRARAGRMSLTGYGFVIAPDGRYRRICNAIAVLELVR